MSMTTDDSEEGVVALRAARALERSGKWSSAHDVQKAMYNDQLDSIDMPSPCVCACGPVTHSRPFPRTRYGRGCHAQRSPQVHFTDACAHAGGSNCAAIRGGGSSPRSYGRGRGRTAPWFKGKGRFLRFGECFVWVTRCGCGAGFAFGLLVVLLLSSCWLCF